AEQAEPLQHEGPQLRRAHLTHGVRSMRAPAAQPPASSAKARIGIEPAPLALIGRAKKRKSPAPARAPSPRRFPTTRTSRASSQLWAGRSASRKLSTLPQSTPSSFAPPSISAWSEARDRNGQSPYSALPQWRSQPKWQSTALPAKPAPPAARSISSGSTAAP